MKHFQKTVTSQSLQQSVYVAKRFIKESSWLFSDIIDVFEKFNESEYLVTIDIEKPFDSLDHALLISLLGKFGSKSYS